MNETEVNTNFPEGSTVLLTAQNKITRSKDRQRVTLTRYVYCPEFVSHKWWYFKLDAGDIESWKLDVQVSAFEMREVPVLRKTTKHKQWHASYVTKRYVEFIFELKVFQP